VNELFAGRGRSALTVADVARFGISYQTSAEIESELTFLDGGYYRNNWQNGNVSMEHRWHWNIVGTVTIGCTATRLMYAVFKGQLSVRDRVLPPRWVSHRATVNTPPPFARKRRVCFLLS
jgi:hypothetical protein